MRTSQPIQTQTQNPVVDIRNHTNQTEPPRPGQDRLKNMVNYGIHQMWTILNHKYDQDMSHNERQPKPESYPQSLHHKPIRASKTRSGPAQTISKT